MTPQTPQSAPETSKPAPKTRWALVAGVAVLVFIYLAYLKWASGLLG
jgi:hypothetical protein